MVELLSYLVGAFVGIVAGRLAWAFLDESLSLEQRTRSLARGVS